MNKKKQLLGMGKGFFWIFFSAVFLFHDFHINEISIFPDILGYIFGTIAIIYLVRNKNLLDTGAQAAILGIAVFFVLGLIDYISINFFHSTLENSIWTSLISISLPIIALLTALVGYNLSKKHIPSLEKSWAILSMLYSVLFIVFLGVIIYSGIIILGATSSTAEPKMIPLLMPLFFIGLIIIYLATFIIIWKTYLHLRGKKTISKLTAPFVLIGIVVVIVIFALSIFQPGEDEQIHTDLRYTNSEFGFSLILPSSINEYKVKIDRNPIPPQALATLTFAEGNKTTYSPFIEVAVFDLGSWESNLGTNNKYIFDIWKTANASTINPSYDLSDSEFEQVKSSFRTLGVTVEANVKLIE